MPSKAPSKASKPRKTATKTAEKKAVTKKPTGKVAAKTTTAKSTSTRPTAAKAGAAKPAAAKTTTRATAKSARPPAARAAAKSRAKSTRPAGRAGKAAARSAAPVFVPRAMPVIDDDDVLMAHGAGGGYGYGRCGGRMLGSQLEQTICDRLGNAGVAHSHSPRHFEVNIVEKQVAAYAPMIVLRGRGREGKSVVIEASEVDANPILKKAHAFRAQYGQEYYVILVAPEEVLEEVPLSTYDEGCAETDLNTLIARLAE